MTNRSMLLIALCTGAARATAQAPHKLPEDTIVDRSTVPIAPLEKLPRAAWGAAVSTIDSAEIGRSAAQTFSELLQARRPGVRVLRSGGLSSDGSSVMLRGPTSMFLSSRPVLVVDGIRVDNRQYDFPLSLGAMAPSRLDDIEPEDLPPHWDIAIDRSTHRGLLARCRCAVPVHAHGARRLESSGASKPLSRGPDASGHVSLGGTIVATELSLGVTGDDAQGVLPHDQRARISTRE